MPAPDYGQRWASKQKDTYMLGMSKIREAWNENPLLVIGVAAGFMMATSKLIDSVSGIRSRSAYAKRMNRGRS
jgi:hypothetical protein